MSALERRSGTRLTWRRWVTLWVVLAPAILASLVGAAPGAAQEAPEFFQWGPPAALELRPPLNDQRVLEAIDLAVDEDAISTNVLGETRRLMFVWAAVEERPASTAFDPQQARLLLEAAGVRALTLSLEVASTDPLTVQVAEAIAQDLRNNLGAQVTVGTDPGDLVVFGVPLPPTPTPTEAPPGPLDLSLDVTCTPDTFRPDEYVVIECVIRLVNQGETALTGISLDIGGYSGPVPSYFFMWSKRDGEFVPIGTGVLSFEGADLEPGQTGVSNTVLLLKMSEGTFETEMRASVEGQVVASVPIRFVATLGAAEPPTDLLVTIELVSEVGPEAQPVAIYETTVTNQGSSEARELTLTSRYDERATLVSAEPAPASENPAVQLASWDLASFGKESLAPGESLVLRTTYGPSQDGDCWGMSAAAVVEATVGGQEQRYGARPTWDALVGECGGGDGVGIGGGGELPTAFGRGGEGPAPPGGGASWAAVALASAGVLLIGAGLAARRQVRL